MSDHEPRRGKEAHTMKFALLKKLLVAGLIGTSFAAATAHAADLLDQVKQRGTPLLVQIFVIYYGLPSLGISLDPTPAGVIALSANVAAYMSESMRGAINGIARGQWLAAYSLGLSWGQTLRYVIGPQALRIAVPSLSNSLISLIKDTSLVSVITVTELLRSAQEMIAATYQPLPLYLAAAAIYWVLCQILEWVQRWYEKRLSLPARH
ncbi:TPA: amino acid ABC transporter permease [Burkholderia multivorans]|nr:amino acid ABC transporter permease [Burkholderia multivorans]